MPRPQSDDITWLKQVGHDYNIRSGALSLLYITFCHAAGFNLAAVQGLRVNRKMPQVMFRIEQQRGAAENGMISNDVAGGRQISKSQGCKGSSPMHSDRHDFFMNMASFNNTYSFSHLPPPKPQQV